MAWKVFFYKSCIYVVAGSRYSNQSYMSVAGGGYADSQEPVIPALLASLSLDCRWIQNVDPNSYDGYGSNSGMLKSGQGLEMFDVARKSERIPFQLPKDAMPCIDRPKWQALHAGKEEDREEGEEAAAARTKAIGSVHLNPTRLTQLLQEQGEDDTMRDNSCCCCSCTNCLALNFRICQSWCCCFLGKWDELKSDPTVGSAGLNLQFHSES